MQLDLRSQLFTSKKKTFLSNLINTKMIHQIKRNRFAFLREFNKL